VNDIKNKLNILILSFEIYPIFVGGLGILTRDLVTELHNQGHKADVIVPQIPDGVNIKDVIDLGKSVKKYLRLGAKIPNSIYTLDNLHIIQNYKSQWGLLYRNKDLIPSQSKIIYPKNLLKLTRAFGLAFMDWFENHGNDYDIIIGMDWLSGVAVDLLKTKYPKTKVIAYFNATQYDMDMEIKYSKIPIHLFQIKQEFIALDKSDHIISVSDKQKKVILENYNVSENKITTIFNDHIFTPVDTKIQMIDKSKIVLFIGRIATQKGLKFLIKTAKSVVEADSDIKFIIAGDGDSLPEIIDMVCKYNLEQHVIFTGWVNAEEKKKLYASANLFVMPSPSEPFGLTALESIRSNLPVIASENCGFIGVIPSTQTFKYHDTQKFANLITYYLHNPEALKILLKSQQKDLSTHSWPVQVQKFVKLCKLIIST
jgi:glycogen synthase